MKLVLKYAVVVGALGTLATAASAQSGGACCLDDGTCQITPDAASCVVLHGAYRGDASTCAGVDLVCTALNNGGFETGDFTGWTQFGDTVHNGVSSAVGTAQSGAYLGIFGAEGDTGGISQVVPAAAGSPVVVSFWYLSNGTPQSFFVDFGGQTLLSLQNDTAHGNWTHYTFPIFAPVANPVLRFTCRNDPAYIFLDDVTACVGAGSGACYANCDLSTVAPILNANDFQCFLNKFAQGCS